MFLQMHYELPTTPSNVLRAPRSAPLVRKRCSGARVYECHFYTRKDGYCSNVLKTPRALSKHFHGMCKGSTPPRGKSMVRQRGGAGGSRRRGMAEPAPATVFLFFLRLIEQCLNIPPGSHSVRSFVIDQHYCVGVLRAVTKLRVKRVQDLGGGFETVRDALPRSAGL